MVPEALERSGFSLNRIGEYRCPGLIYLFICTMKIDNDLDWRDIISTDTTLGNLFDFLEQEDVKHMQMAMSVDVFLNNSQH